MFNPLLGNTVDIKKHYVYDINECQSTFFLKVCPMGWDKVCVPKKRGGLGE